MQTETRQSNTLSKHVITMQGYPNFALFCACVGPFYWIG